MSRTELHVDASRLVSRTISPGVSNDRRVGISRAKLKSLSETTIDSPRSFANAFQACAPCP